MNKKSVIIAGIDIGSSKIRTAVAIVEDDGMPNLIGLGISPSAGLRKGNITDLNEAIESISASLEDAERMAGEPITHVFVSIGGNHLETFESKGVIAISSRGENEITEDDVNRVLEAAQTISLPLNRKILRIIPKNFSIDNQHNIKYPVGMNGVRLEVDAHLVTGLSPSIKNIEKCVHEAGVDIDDLVPAPLAAAEAVLTKRQKELGVVSIDIGASSTGITVFEENVVLAIATLPVGGENVTNDIAIGMRMSVDTAEKIKIEYGSCSKKDASSRDSIDLTKFGNIDTHKISKKQMFEIIEARYHEILIMVKDELRKIDRDGALPAGAIFTGGAIKIPGFLEMAREILALPVQISKPEGIEGVIEKIDDPSFATTLGLIILGNRFGASNNNIMNLGQVDAGKIWGSIKNWLKRLLP